MTLSPITFSEPVKVEADSDFLAEEAKILGIVDSPNYQKLVVTLEFPGEEPLVKELALVEAEAYADFEDWTYASLQDRIKLYYESDPFAPPEPVPAPEPEPTPESSIDLNDPTTWGWPENPELGNLFQDPHGAIYQWAQPRNADGTFLSDIPDTPEVESAPRWMQVGT